ncbi:nucleoside deaminase [Chitinivibrio alkaliphilus]|uniref:tRNA-specific adenosine deaminase n=1 Tax=Chitinivibrio alkaliphilus ACht1 TaxID=1313304 RepID=U7DA07_9BACT|nr:nucleoside deaminase [Chitinivibrio alkaliphilus]ERP38827.1 CMP/dCMP deaminase zinc-binding protein [Chitinivibrio alkaliphilus ACht1]
MTILYECGESLPQNDELFMQRAYSQALHAYENREVPVGAVVVHAGQIIGRGYNQIEKLQDATAHAEVLCLGAAAHHHGTWRLTECTLYVTLEPCMMCLGAILQSRISRVVFGAGDSRFGALHSEAYRSQAYDAYGRFPEIIPGIYEEQCRELIQRFFREIRMQRKMEKERAAAQNESV